MQVVLVHPDIPQNTGNIARLTAANRTPLHIIEPMGFKITDRHLKRAGLDYWPEVQMTIHSNWDEYLAQTRIERSKLWFFTTRESRTLYEVEFQEGDALVFGSESAGLPAWYHEHYADRRVTIPMENPGIRSLNLSSSAAIALYEARRQIEQRRATDLSGAIRGGEESLRQNRLP